MDIKIVKAFRELLSKPARSLLVVIALVIGISGVGSVVVSYSILKPDLEANFLGTIPPHAVLTAGGLEGLDRAWLGKQPGVEAFELRDLALLRVEAYPDEWITLWLFGFDDFRHPRMALIRPQKGNRVPGPGTMLIERNGMQVSDLDAGKVAMVRSGPNNLDIPVSGICFDPAQAPSTQDHFIYGYADRGTWSRITGEKPGRRLLLRFRNVHSRQEVVAAAGRLLPALRSAGVAVEKVDVPRFNEHPHQWQLNTLLFIIGGIGLLGLFLGAILVSQTMSAILAQQARQIAVMKAIGASRPKVFTIYLLLLVMFGVAAGAVGVPFSVAVGYAFARFVAGILNFDILTTRLPTTLYLVLAGTSVLLPILLSLPAILKALGRSVIGALHDYGIRQSAYGEQALVSLTRSLPGILPLALRNTVRNRKRFLVTIASIAFGTAIFQTGFNTRQSLWNYLSETNHELNYDVQVVLKSPTGRKQLLAPFSTLRNVGSRELWNGGRGELQSRIVSTGEGVGLVALPYDTGSFRPRIVEGRWLGRPSEGDAVEIVMNQQATDLYGHPHPGRELELNIGGRNTKTRLVGICEELEKAKIYMDVGQYDIRFNPGHLANNLLFTARDRSYAKVMELKREIERRVRSSDLDILYVMAQAERVKIIYDHLDIILSTILLVAFLVLLVSALGMASATGINIMERTREIGVMRAIGATPKEIFRQFVIEGTIVAVIGTLFGLAFSWSLSIVVAQFFGDLMLGGDRVLRQAFSPSGVWITFLATLAFGLMASRIPAGSAVRVSIREALSYE